MAAEEINDDLGLGQTLRGFAAGQKVFKRYILQKLLGRGGMGVVWLAHDEKLNEQVALKFLPESLTSDPEAVADLKHETKRSRELNHHFIVRIHDFLEDELVAGISMEYVDGKTLTELKLQQPGRCFNPGDLMGLVAQLCAALDYAHNVAKVVHRDLKPSNFMVNSKQELKVTDFGIARSISDTASRLSGRPGTSGTPVYMSPQQANGERPSVSDDIYALGATLYELLTGKPPFFSGDILDQLKHKVPDSMQSRRKQLGIERDEIPQHWELAIRDCLAKEPGDRPKSAVVLSQRLLGGAELEQDPSTPPPKHNSEPSPHEILSPERKRVLKALLGVGLGLLAVASALILRKAVTGQSKFLDSRGGQAESYPTGRLWTNSLGLPFTRIPGTSALFCIWDTRVIDWERFQENTGYRTTDDPMWCYGPGPKWGFHAGYNWRNPGFEFHQTEAHPVVGISWIDARVFCEWLTKKERTMGLLSKNESYRLPADEEWSVAVGLPTEVQELPSERNGKVENFYAWGSAWPPPLTLEILLIAHARSSYGSEQYVVEGYDDGFAETSPVGSFTPNKFGLYDMCGNVWQICEDYFGWEHDKIVVRGGAWNSRARTSLLASARGGVSLMTHDATRGFRCVLASDKK